MTEGTVTAYKQKGSRVVETSVNPSQGGEFCWKNVNPLFHNSQIKKQAAGCTAKPLEAVWEQGG